MREQPCFPFLTILAFSAWAWGAANAGAAPSLRGDLWLTNPPPDAITNTAHYNSLRAESLAGLLKIYCDGPSNASLFLVSSDEPPGHWPARDWRTNEMLWRGGRWDWTHPVEDLDTPIIYRVEGKDGPSAFRFCHPRAAGLTAPTKVFWPFLEGFEEGIGPWKILAPARSVPLETTLDAHTGLKSLKLQIPAGKNNLVLGTPRLRGWKAALRRANGVGVWIKAPAAGSRARLSLRANAFSPQETIFENRVWLPLQPGWQKLECSFSSFPKLEVLEVDWLDLEISGPGEASFQIDDLHLTGFFGPGQKF